MNHLGLELGDLESIPWLDACKYRPEVGFHDFPEAVGWKVNDNHGCEAQGHLHRDFTPFLQSWLFFGLLHTVLVDSHDELDVYHDFVGPEGRYLSTERLGASLERWKKHEEEQWKKYEERLWRKHGGEQGKELVNGHPTTETENQESDERITETYSTRMVRIQMALNRARGVVKRYCSLDGPKLSGNEYPGPGREMKDRFDLVSLSLIVLGETLANAKVKIVEQIGFKIRGWNDETADGWGTSTHIKEKMENEWCSKTLHVLEGQFRGNTTGLLAAYSLQPFRGQNHRKCTKDSCRLTHVENDDHYKLRHSRKCERVAEDDCGWAETNPEELETIINRGAIPLLLLENGGSTSKISVRVTDNFECKEYVTISHVWSDGYGNPRANRLHQCQLKFLKEALDSVDKGRSKNEKLAFWMDTLAIPVGDDFKEARKIAIGKIHETFVRSRYTIVIDQGLCEKMRGVKYHEIAMRILASGWMRRLWTLQEAYLSGRILFKFKDEEALDLEELEAMYPSANDTLNSCIPAIARSYFHSLLGTARRARIHDMTPKEGLSLIASVWKATQWRTTTHKQHEVLALATLFNLNTGRSEDADSLNQAFIAGEKDKEHLDKNMCTLLRLLEEIYPGSIPAGIIFLPGERLSAKGYGWAPRTWIAGQVVDYPDPLAIDTPTTRFVPGQGLYVEFPGFLLHSSPGANPITQMDHQTLLRFPVDSTLTEWYEIKHADQEKKDAPRGQNAKSGSRPIGYAIMLLRQRPRDVKEIALLVETRQPVIQRSFNNTKETHIFHVSIMFRIWINRVTEVDRKDISKFRVNSGSTAGVGEGGNSVGKQVFGEILDHDQKWCVDQNQELTTPAGDSPSGLPGPGPSQPTQLDLNSVFRATEVKKASDEGDRQSERSGGFVSGMMKRAVTWGVK